MFNLNLEKPKNLILGDNLSLLYVRLEKIKKNLYGRKIYIRFRREYEKLLEKLLESNLTEKEVIKIDKRLKYLKKYCDNQEYNSCLQLDEFFLAEMCLNPNLCKNGFIEV